MKMFNFIDEEKAKELIAKGFVARESEISGTKVFSFIESEDLLKEIHGNFSEDKKSFFVNDMMYF